VYRHVLVKFQGQIQRTLAKDNSRVRFFKPRQIPEVGCLTILVTYSAQISRHYSRHMAQVPTIYLGDDYTSEVGDMPYALDSLLLIYFMGAATDTTMLSVGKESMRAFRRRSYSSEGIPGVSSFGLTIRRHFFPSASQK
jgi:hypothetical protein